MGLAMLQLMAGALVRHVPVQASPETFQIYVAFHLIGAALLTLNVLLLAGLIWTRFRDLRVLTRPGGLLLGLIACQLLLGVFTWGYKYGWPVDADRYTWLAGHLIEADGLRQSLIVTGHVATGSLILATSVVLVLYGFRRVSAVAAALSLQASWGATTT
jgi:cytochrome c oxidase assembly protein subunit 15